jgi:hypothetical protein
MKLETKVQAVNEVNRQAKIVLDGIIPQLQMFIGQKIFLANGNTAKKFVIQYPEVKSTKIGDVECAILYGCYLYKSYHSICLNLTCRLKMVDTACTYEKFDVYVGNLDDSGQILTTVKTEGFLFKNYSVDEIRALFVRKEQVENELRELKSKLRDFEGFYD